MSNSNNNNNMNKELEHKAEEPTNKYKETKREMDDRYYFGLGINYLRDEYFE